MKKKENVYKETKATETVTEVKAETGVGLPQEDSAVAKKFKDVNALARAYESLQAEFTRRSQRLKELEKRTENPYAEVGATSGSADSGAEKLRKNAESRREQTREFDEFVSQVNKAREPIGPDEEIRPVATAENSDGNAENAANGQVHIETTEKEGERLAEKKGDFVADNASPSVAGNVPSTEDLYAQVCRDEGVRLRIIGEYLSSVGRGAAPITAAGAGPYVSPPRKAKNLGDAAAMALQYFKKP